MSNDREFPKKWKKVIDNLPEFKDNAESLDVEGLEGVVVKAEGNIYNIEQEMKSDVKLQQAKEIVKELSSGYREAIKVQTAKLKYSLYLMETKGKEVGGTTED